MTSKHLFEIWAVINFAGIILMVYHLNQSVKMMASKGQIMRYVVLLFYAGVFTYSSLEQIQQHIEWSDRHWLALLASLVLIATMVVSIRENKKRRP